MQNYNKASATVPSPPPSPTVVPHQVWVSWLIPAIAWGSHPTSNSSYPAVTSSQPQRWPNIHSTSERRQTNSTSPPVSVSILFSSQANLPPPTTSQFLTRRWSTTYDANNTIFTISKGAILRGFCDPVLNLYQIPLVDMVRNNNTNTIIVNCPPTKFLPDQPPPSKAVYNVYKLKTQPELVQYHHASRDSPPNPHGLPPSRTNSLHLGLGWLSTQHEGTSPILKRRTRATAGRPQAVYAPPRPSKAHSLTTAIMHLVPIKMPSYLYNQWRRRRQSSIAHLIWRMKPRKKNCQTSRAGSQRNPARAISTSWYSRRATVTSSSLKQWRITHLEKWFGHIKSSTTA